MRIPSLILTFCLLSNLVFAEAFVINNFSGGQDSHMSEYNTLDSTAHEAVNVRVNKTLSALSNRENMTKYASLGSAVKSLFRYYKTDSTKYLIATAGDKIYYDTTTGTLTEMRSDMTDSKRFKWFTYQDKVIGFNESDQPVVWDGDTNSTADTDGHRTSGELMAELGAPFAELNTGSNLDAESWYQYRIAYYDGTTYYYSTARSNPILTGASVHDITLTDIPLGPAGTTARYIYRTEGKASKADVLAETSFYKVATISDNYTTTYDDSVTDATLVGDAVPTWETVSAGENVTPPIGEIGTIHKERFFKNETDESSYLFWSEPFLPHFFDTGNYEVIREDDGDEITGIVEQLGILVVLKTNSISKLFTSSADDDAWYYNTFSQIGCHAPYTPMLTKVGIVYLNRSGLYTFNGQYSNLMSDAVTDVIEDISDTDMINATSVYFNNEYHLSYTSTETGSAVNDRVLVYDLTRDAFVLDHKEIDSFCLYNSGDDYSAIMAGSSDGYVWAFNETPSVVLLRTKNQLDQGTFDDVRTYGADNDPTMEIGWDCDIDGWLAELQTKNASISTLDDVVTYLPDATIDRPDTDGTWTSPVYKVNASSYDKLYWNENLGVGGDITFQIRSGSTESACEAASWSGEYTNANGTDISSETADAYIQLKANFSVDDIEHTPKLIYQDGYIIKLIYSTAGATQETGVVSSWDTGWKSLQRSEEGQLHLKKIDRIKVYYTGESGDITVSYVNDQGDVDREFTVDLDVVPPLDIDDDGYEDYLAQGEHKVRVYYPPSNMGTTDPSSIGQKFRFNISSENADAWTIYAVEVRYEILPFND